MAEDDDVKLSPADVDKLKAVRRTLSEASGILQDIPEDVREEYGNLEDAISKLEEVDDLIGDCLPEDEAAASGE